MWQFWITLNCSFQNVILAELDGEIAELGPDFGPVLGYDCKVFAWFKLS